MPDRPRIVCVCGSMRFQDTMHAVAESESLEHRVVLMPHVNMKRPDGRWSTWEKSAVVKTGLDALHRWKIWMADEVLVVNPGGYIGDSTRREIAYAEECGRPVRYLVPVGLTVEGGTDA